MLEKIPFKKLQKQIFIYFLCIFTLISMEHLDKKIAFAQQQENKKIVLNYFFNNKCPYCQKAHVYLNMNANYFKNNNVEVRRYDVEKTEAKKIFINKIKQFNIPKDKILVPFFVIGDIYFLGYNEQNNHTDNLIKYAIAICKKKNTCSE